MNPSISKPRPVQAYRNDTDRILRHVKLAFLPNVSFQRPISKEIIEFEVLIFVVSEKHVIFAGDSIFS